MSSSSGSGGQGMNYEQTVLADEPLVFFRFEESSDAGEFADSVDALRRLTKVNPNPDQAKVQTVPDSAPGLGRSVQPIVGSSAYLEFDDTGPAIEVRDYSPLSIELWIRPEPPIPDIVTIPPPDFYYYYPIVYGTTASPARLYSQLRFLNPVEFPQLSFVFAEAPTADEVPIASWTHVVFSRRDSLDCANVGPGTIDIILNGTIIVTLDSCFVALPAVESKLRIGGYPSVNRGFRGNIDEVAIYDYALTEAQARAHYEAGIKQ
jgi:hypothetical protein